MFIDNELDDTIVIHKHNEVFAYIQTTPSIEAELSDYFSFDDPKRFFKQAYKMKRWDGKNRLFSRLTKLFPVGIIYKLKEFADDINYKIILLEKVRDGRTITEEEAREFYANLGTPPGLVPYEWQIESLVHAVNKNRALFLSATSSGKALMIRAITGFYSDQRCLVIAPNVGLVVQLSKEMVLNGADANDIHQIYFKRGEKRGVDNKTTNKRIVVTTWQSLQKLPKEWFEPFGVVIVDECHGAKAEQLKFTLEKMVNTRYRFGLTGTLDGMETNELICQGLLGPIKKLVTAREMIDLGVAPPLNINMVVLKYPEDVCKANKKMTYDQEDKFLEEYERRTKFICNLALKQKRSTLILFKHLEHGRAIYDMLKKKDPNRSVYFIAGEVDIPERERIQEMVEKHPDSIVVAIEKIYAVGINIKNLDVLILASMSKARIKTIQAIGRLLRKGSGTTEVTVWDIIDNMTWKKRKNYAIQHFFERCRIYDSEKHIYKTIRLNLGDDPRKKV